MLFESALRINASPECAGYPYNYFVSRAGEHINYNEDNRNPVSPIGLTGGNEDRAIKARALARLIPAMQEVTLHHRLHTAGLAGPGPRKRRRTKTSLVMRGIPLAEKPAGSGITGRTFCRAGT